jgi:diadenosine tetraphosphate (Ap4A) HIT family hydrolase
LTPRSIKTTQTSNNANNKQNMKRKLHFSMPEWNWDESGSQLDSQVEQKVEEKAYGVRSWEKESEVKTGKKIEQGKEKQKQEKSEIDRYFFPVTLGAYEHPGRINVPRFGDSALKPYLEKDLSIQAKKQIFVSLKEAVVIYDGYPKAHVHLLVIPRPSFLSAKSLHDIVFDSDMEKLKVLHSIADSIAQHVFSAAPRRTEIWTGYHLRPSLHPLHIHIISTDLTYGQYHRHKKHWNSYTTPLFIKCDDVMTEWYKMKTDSKSTSLSVLESERDPEVDIIQPQSLGEQMILSVGGNSSVDTFEKQAYTCHRCRQKMNKQGPKGIQDHYMKTCPVMRSDDGEKEKEIL